MAEQPTISVGMPVFNGERFLEISARALLDQTFEDFELIIGDNASTDATPDICRRLAAADDRVRIVRHASNIGAVENFNAVVRQSVGRFFKWAADDDLHHPRFLEACLEALHHHPESVLAYTRAESITSADVVLRPDWGDRPEFADASAAIRYRAALAPPRDPIPLPMFAVIRADTLSSTGLLAPMPEFDRALIAELALHGSFIEVPDVLFGHREHDQRMGPALASNSGKAAALLGQQRRLPHWRLWQRHLASVSRRPQGVAARPLLRATTSWAWRWRHQLISDLTDAAMQPLGAIAPLGRLAERSRSRRRMNRWDDQQRSMTAILAKSLRSDDRLILIDGDSLDIDQLKRWSTQPLQPSDSPDGSIPPTAQAAITRLIQQRDLGFTHVAIAWPAFWVLDYYRDFARHLDENCRLLSRSQDVILYRLPEHTRGPTATD